jgi:glycosyltransferase involved in cell wall biosynthesis
LYSSEEWNCLMQALEGIGWMIDGRHVEVRALGRIFGINAHGERNIRFYGWRSQQETIEILSGCDVLYCPYWFSPKFEEESRLSFPSKLTSYLASGRPVLFHGPTYASPSRFLQEQQAALQCNSLNKKAIIESLQKLVRDSKLYERLTSNGNAAFHAHLTEERTQAQFLKAMGY